MALPTAAEFLVRYPEFVRIPTTLIDARIADAAERVDAATWDTEYAHGVCLWAAHLLSISPSGQNARLASDKADTTYARAFAEAVVRVTCGIRTF